MNRYMLEKYCKMGGWLLFLYICDVLSLIYAFFNLFSTIEMIVQMIGYKLSSTKTIYLGVLFLTVVSFIFLLLRVIFISLRKRSTVIFFIIMNAISMTFSAIFLVSEAPESVGGWILLTYTIQMAIFVLTIFYFKVSERAKLYFTSDEAYSRLVAEARNKEASQDPWGRLCGQTVELN